MFISYKSEKPGYFTKRSRLGLTASHSRERALDGSPGENSPFAAVILKKLQESVTDPNVLKLATEVIDHVQSKTSKKQTPVFKTLAVEGDEQGQYVFFLRANEVMNLKTDVEFEVLQESLKATNLGIFLNLVLIVFRQGGRRKR